MEALCGLRELFGSFLVVLSHLTCICQPVYSLGSPGLRCSVSPAASPSCTQSCKFQPPRPPCSPFSPQLWALCRFSSLPCSLEAASLRAHCRLTVLITVFSETTVLPAVHYLKPHVQLFHPFGKPLAGDFQGWSSSKFPSSRPVYVFQLSLVYFGLCF